MIMKSITALCLAIFAVAVMACGSAFAPANAGEPAPDPPQAVFNPENATYHEAVVDPCTPLPRSDADPCALRDWENRYWIDYIAQDQEFFTEVEVESEYFLPYPPPTALEVIRAKFEQEKGATGYGYSGRLPHIIARGVFVPGTARCAMHDHRVDAHPDPNLFNAPPNTSDIECYMDFNVREYVIGKGPERLTVRPFTDVPYSWKDYEYYSSPEYLKKVSKRADAVWADSEFVVELGLNNYHHVEVWAVRGIADLQKRSDGTVFLYWNNSVELYTEEYGDVSEYLDVLEPPWDDYVRDTRNARATVEAEHDFSFADDANLLHLREYLKNYGHYEEFAEYISPPPPPFTD